MDSYYFSKSMPQIHMYVLQTIKFQSRKRSLLQIFKKNERKETVSLLEWRKRKRKRKRERERERERENIQFKTSFSNIA